jgi:thioredoxin 1
MNPLIIGVFVGAGLLIVFMIWSYYKSKNAPEVKASKEIIPLTMKNIRQQTRTGTVIIQFWAAGSAPCIQMLPSLNEIAENKEMNVKVGRVNVQHQQNLIKKFKIRSLPTLIYYKDGEEVAISTGFKSKRAILKMLKAIDS